MFKDKILLITGGTGSFGTTALKHFLHLDFAEIRVFSRDEKKQEDMRIAFKSDRLKFYIGDVREYDSVHDVYQFNWKTDRQYAQTCRQLVVTLNDGGNHTAYFEFR